MRRAVSWLGARGATAYLLIAYSVFLCFLAVWAARVPAPVVANISRLAPFGLVYVAAGVHLVFCLVASWPGIRGRTSLAFPPADELAELPRACPPHEVEALARTGGFRLRWRDGGRRAVLSRNRWSPLGTVLFHGALLLLPVAWLLSGATRFEGRAWVVEGHPFGGTRQEYYQVSPSDDFEARAPRLGFRVEEVRARFWGERLFFTDLRALVAVPRGDEADARWLRLPKPAWIDGARVSIRGFNYTPAVELVGADGRLAESADLSLRLFPPGSEDSFALPRLPHRFWVCLYPDSAGPSAIPLNRGFDLRRPLFHLAVTCGKRLVTHGWLRPGEALAFDGHRIAFPRVRRGGEVLVHRDRGYPLAWFALAAGLTGLVARVFFPASRVWIVAEDGRTLAAARDDVFGPGRGAALVRELGRRAD